VNGVPAVPACQFCGGRRRYRYRMDSYPVWQCIRCGTGCAWPMPEPALVQRYYRGFLAATNERRLAAFGALREAARSVFRDMGLAPGGALRMLDVGGGGGFFSRAFEECGYGESTYVDLDPLSCAFARERLGLRRVVNGECADVAAREGGRFDFIYCRHVIEHLPDPAALLESMVLCLAPRGVLAVQFPNGDSLEYLAYPAEMRWRWAAMRRGSRLSATRLLWLMLAGAMLHDLDPPRHLWAVTGAGVTAWARGRGLECRVRTADLGDPAYSPYYARSSDLAGRARDFVGQRVLARLRGGCHCVAVLRLPRAA